MLGISVWGAAASRACQLSRLPQPQLVDQQLPTRRCTVVLKKILSVCGPCAEPVESSNCMFRTFWWLWLFYLTNLMIVIILSDKSSLSDKIILPSAPCFDLPGFHDHVSCLSFLRLIAIGISLNTSTIFGESCKLWSFSLLIFFLPPFRSYFLRVRLHISGDSLYKFTQ